MNGPRSGVTVTNVLQALKKACLQAFFPWKLYQTRPVNSFCSFEDGEVALHCYVHREAIIGPPQNSSSSMKQPSINSQALAKNIR